MPQKALLKKTINDLISLVLNNGIQPSDLADNIFLKEYRSITYRTIGNEIIGEAVFEELIDKKPTLTKLIYHYNSSKQITLIEEEFLGVLTVIWDRECEEQRLLDEIIFMIKSLGTNNDIDKFIKTLPKEIKEKLDYSDLNKSVS